MGIEWSEPALEDLAAIRDYIGKDSPHYARQFIERIFAATEQLERHPAMGRRVPEAGRDDIRELIYRNYRIIYQTTANKTTILTVVHGRRNLNRS